MVRLRHFAQFRFVPRDEFTRPIQQVDDSRSGGLAAGPQLQIFQPIVISEVVYVMDVLAFAQSASQVAFHHVVMLVMPVGAAWQLLAKVSGFSDCDVTSLHHVSVSAGVIAKLKPR